MNIYLFEMQVYIWMILITQVISKLIKCPNQAPYVLKIFYLENVGYPMRKDKLFPKWHLLYPMFSN